MIDFDKQKILEKILKEVPVLTNKRGIVNVEGTDRVVYAYYCNRGEKDPDLHYNRRTNPLSTTPDSTLCEIYSVFGKEDDKLRKRLIKEGEMKKRQLLYKGPWIGDFTHPAENARQGYDTYDFCHSTSNFLKHFNQICFSLEYNISLVSLSQGQRYALKLVSKGRIELDGKSFEGNLPLVMPLGIDLIHKDPSLSIALASIEETRQKLLESDLSSIQILCFRSC